MSPDLPSLELLGKSLGVASQTLEFLVAVKKIRGSGTISAYFDEKGEFITGDKRIKVITHSTSRKAIWWYTVEGPKGYTFVRLPVIDSQAVEVCGYPNKGENADASYWRWIKRERPGVIIDNRTQPANLLVDFIVIGYKPKALLDYFSTRAKK